MSFREIFLSILFSSFLMASLSLNAMDNTRQVLDLNTLDQSENELSLALETIWKNLHAGGHNAEIAKQGLINLSLSLPAILQSHSGFSSDEQRNPKVTSSRRKKIDEKKNDKIPKKARLKHQKGSIVYNFNNNKNKIKREVGENHSQNDQGDNYACDGEGAASRSLEGEK